MSSILKVYFYNLNVFANVEHEKFVLRKPNTSPITNHFAWRINAKKKKKVCIGGSPSLCNVSVCQGSIPCESLNYAHFFWGRFTSCEFVHLLFYMTGSRCAVCVTHALILWPLSLAFLFFCLFVWVFFLRAVFSCFYFIWVMFHSYCSFLRRQWMYKYEIQFLYCLLMFPNLQEACYLCSF